ncbi:helix-turn-helix domain-containing protein [Dactylosporangium matsuzakiense]|uniref:HTH iclR-type domain-containing protein n=1 Tax=Dactylosporangium matsuzakiense TaxID=53360 RepID=A0A9W6KDD6_9ACTN|nr:helix-turn-helix domain-containing protein [Dactylosporangium matsuzakiense]GLK99192.1 hypothetical protein GCM10017581_009330 [Dactylosporangium matsuzakiense]
MTIGLELVRTSNDRVFELLDALASLGPGAHRLRDVAARARLATPTAHRILQAAIRAGTVSKARRGQYCLTARAGAPDPQPVPSTPATISRHAAPDAPGPASLSLAISRRIRIGLAALQKATGQPVLLYVPLFLDAPMRYCLAYFAPERDELLGDAERLLATDMVFCAPLTVDAAGRLIEAHMMGHRPDRAEQRERAILQAGYTYGPSPVAGWDTLAAPLRRYGHIAGAICIAARTGWLEEHRDRTVAQLRQLASELSDEIPPR